MKPKARKDTVASAKTSSESISDDVSGVVGIAIDLTGISSSGIEREKPVSSIFKFVRNICTKISFQLPEMPNTRKSFGRKVDQIATSSMGSDKGNSSKLKSSTKQTKSGHGTGYQYEIDCTKVSDSINVTDLVIFSSSKFTMTHIQTTFVETIPGD